MDELMHILRDHAARYPLMQPADAVKLIYQNEFGGGHLIRDEQACLQHLRREYGSLVKDPSGPLYEQIGNGIVRVYLAALTESRLQWLGDAFLRSAAAHTGSLDRFIQKLDVLGKVVADGYFSFGPEELDAYLISYRAAGYPMVSHSQIYRHSYSPAYRVICQGFLQDF